MPEETRGAGMNVSRLGGWNVGDHRIGEQPMVHRQPLRWHPGGGVIELDECICREGSQGLSHDVDRNRRRKGPQSGNGDRAIDYRKRANDLRLLGRQTVETFIENVSEQP